MNTFPKFVEVSRNLTARGRAVRTVVREVWILPTNIIFDCLGCDFNRCNGHTCTRLICSVLFDGGFFVFFVVVFAIVVFLVVVAFLVVAFLAAVFEAVFVIAVGWTHKSGA